MITFKEWLKNRELIKNETGTSTANIAVFARPLVFNDDKNKKTHIIRRIPKNKY